MNCAHAQRLLSTLHDGALPTPPPSALAAHLAACPACRTFETGLTTTGAWLRTRPVPAGPTPEVVWANVQRTLRQGDPSAARTRHTRWDWLTARPWQFAGGAVAAALILVVALWGWGPADRSLAPVAAGHVGAPAAAAAPSHGPTTEVLHLSTGLAGASTMVYEDAQTGWTVIWVLPEEGPNHAHS